MLRSRVPLAQYEVFDLERIADDTGTLHVAELSRRGSEPFERVVFLSDVPAGRSRGGHAHKEQAEYVICVHGSVDVRIESQGDVALVALDRVGRTLFLPAGYWRDLRNFSPGTVLAILAAHPFSEDDYIRDHADFQRWERMQ